MKWDQVDLAAGVWTKPHTMTKQEREHAIPLSAPARQLLGRLHKRSGDSPWVFPGRDGGPREDLKYAWKRICKTAGMPVCASTICATHASNLVSAGFSLPTIGALLGHSQPRRRRAMHTCSMTHCDKRPSASAQSFPATQVARSCPSTSGGGDDQAQTRRLFRR